MSAGLAGGGSRRVLVVDDDPGGLSLLETLFRAHGYVTETAVDGLDALEKARAAPCAVVVTDILMPRMDGYQLCREWKADPVLRESPVVFYTATYTAQEDRDFATGVGADLFIVKPTDPDAIIRSVEALLTAHLEEGIDVREPTVTEETEVLREYNERLVAKLEHKITELEFALRAVDQEVEAKTGLIERLGEDIDRRKQAEKELQRSNELLRAVVYGSPLGIVATDPDGRVRLWNPGSERLFGWSELEMLERPYPFAGAEGVQHMLEVARGGASRSTVERLEGMGETSIDAEVYTAPLLDAAGEFDGVVVLIADLTQRAQIDRLKQDFVQVVGHELRTPLTTIIGYGDLLASMRAKGELEPEKVAELVERMRTQGAALAQLIDDLLVVLQLESEGLKLEMTCADARELVRGRAEAQRLTKHHKLVLDLPHEPAQLECDPSQLGLAFKNVLVNAVKFSPDGGEVRVCVTEDAGEVRIAVADDGIGIASEDLPNIFGLFTQLDMSTTRRFGGFGMGLYLTKRIVEAHRGHVEVESTPGAGSTFTIVLPTRAGPDPDGACA
jgi:PAS domain S-box-containing protein